MTSPAPVGKVREVSPERLRALIGALSEGLVEREQPLRLALLAALAGEHILLVGPPGTAKSELARRLRRAFRGATYFERLLTRFSVPEELFGPLSITALEQDRYERQIEGYLPSASIAFIDEVFKASSAILNALLTLLNEREFDNGHERIACPLISVVGATNEVPPDEAIEAFHDRFLIRCPVGPVSHARFGELLSLPARAAAEPAAALPLTHAELVAIREHAHTVRIPPEVVALLTDLRDWLVESGVYVSDRRWCKIGHLLRVSAMTHGRDEVIHWDAWLVQFAVGDTREQQQAVGDWYARWLGTDGVADPERYARIVQAFEEHLILEQEAGELEYDSHGRLALHAPGDKAAGVRQGLQAGPLRRRRYGARHIAARVEQVREAVAQLDACIARIERIMEEIDSAVALHLWIAPAFAQTAREHLAGTRDNVAALRSRAAAAAAGFAALPPLEAGEGELPEPIQAL